MKLIIYSRAQSNTRCNTARLYKINTFCVQVYHTKEYAYFFDKAQQNVLKGTWNKLAFKFYGQSFTPHF
jgi:hypothetical protein